MQQVISLHSLTGHRVTQLELNIGSMPKTLERLQPLICLESSLLMEEFLSFGLDITIRV